jgi:hypothetical protein
MFRMGFRQAFRMGFRQAQQELDPDHSVWPSRRGCRISIREPS